MGRRVMRVSVALDQESIDLLDRISRDLAECNRSLAARRAIRVAAQVLLDQESTQQPQPRRSYVTRAN